MKIKLLFQGDSITDCGRFDQSSNFFGDGYPLHASELLKEKYPQIDFEFINLGISGNQTKDLVNRLQEDFIDVNPDIVSILIGINDVWHHSVERDWIDNSVFEERYRTVLQNIKDKTHAKIMIMEPFLLPAPDKLFFREDLGPKIEIIRKLAREYADSYMPTDGLFASALIGTDYTVYCRDGVHPSVEGRKVIAKHYVEYISPIIDEMIK